MRGSPLRSGRGYRWRLMACARCSLSGEHETVFNTLLSRSRGCWNRLGGVMIDTECSDCAPARRLFLTTADHATPAPLRHEWIRTKVPLNGRLLVFARQQDHKGPGEDWYRRTVGLPPPSRRKLTPLPPCAHWLRTEVHARAAGAIAEVMVAFSTKEPSDGFDELSRPPSSRCSEVRHALDGFDSARMSAVPAFRASKGIVRGVRP